MIKDELEVFSSEEGYTVFRNALIGKYIVQLQASVPFDTIGEAYATIHKVQKGLLHIPYSH